MTKYSNGVRKAVIPAAGLGTRFIPYTKSQPKEMIPLIDRPTIQYVVEEVISSGIETICIIDSRGKSAIRHHFDETSDRLRKALEARGKYDDIERLERLASIGDKICYVNQPSPDGLGGAVLCAKKWIDDEPFALLLGDDIIASDMPATRQLLQVYDSVRKPVIAVEHVENVSAYGIVDRGKKVRGLDRAHYIKRLVEKPKPSEAPSDMGIVGRYILEPSIFAYLEGIRSVNGEKQLTDAMQRSLEVRGSKGIVAYEFKGKRIDTGTPFSWLTANIDMALEDPEMGPKITEFMKRKVA